jgi:OmpA-OmpF porin, OOP family
MKHSMKSATAPLGASACVWLLAAAGTLCLPLQAQTILKGKDLSEKNLIEALTPPAAAVGAEEEEDVRVRSIRVTRDQPSAKVVEQMAKAPPVKTSASLLITFITNSAELTDRARSQLDVVGRALQADQLTNFKFSIEGHADPRGNPDDNLRLSQGRADSVVDYLATRHNISRDRLKSVGKGASELVNSRQADAPENRRVTIVTLRE